MDKAQTEMDDRANKVLILGIGNDIQQDVGIPVKLTMDMKDLFPGETVDCESLFVGGLELLEYIHGYRGAIFIDTIRTVRQDAGRVHVFSIQDYQDTLHLSCRHDVTFQMSLKLGKKLGFLIPGNIMIIGIEILEDLEFGAKLSKDLNLRYNGIRRKVKNLVNGFCKNIEIKSTDQNKDGI
jgi:hydrogenase maturation protease